VRKRAAVGHRGGKGLDRCRPPDQAVPGTAVPADPVRGHGHRTRARARRDAQVQPDLPTAAGGALVQVAEHRPRPVRPHPRAGAGQGVLGRHPSRGVPGRAGRRRPGQGTGGLAGRGERGRAPPAAGGGGEPARAGTLRGGRAGLARRRTGRRDQHPVPHSGTGRHGQGTQDGDQRGPQQPGQGFPRRVAGSRCSSGGLRTSHWRPTPSTTSGHARPPDGRVIPVRGCTPSAGHSRQGAVERSAYPLCSRDQASPLCATSSSTGAGAGLSASPLGRRTA